MSMQETHTMTRDNLFSATQIMPVVPDKMTVAQAGVVKRGTLLDADGAAVTGTAEVYAVLAADVDTTDAAKDAPVYLTGEFSADALTVGASAEVSTFVASARKVCIFIKQNIPA